MPDFFLLTIILWYLFIGGVIVGAEIMKIAHQYDA